MSNKNVICVIIIVVILLLILGICLAFMFANNKLIKGGRRSFWENDSSNPLKTDDKCFETFEKIREFITKNDKLSIVIANMPVYTCAKAYSPVIFVDPSNSGIRSDGYSENDISFIWAKMTSDEFFEYISASDIAMKNKINVIHHDYGFGGETYLTKDNMELIKREEWLSENGMVVLDYSAINIAYENFDDYELFVPNQVYPNTYDFKDLSMENAFLPVLFWNYMNTEKHKFGIDFMYSKWKMDKMTYNIHIEKFKNNNMRILIYKLVAYCDCEIRYVIDTKIKNTYEDSKEYIESAVLLIKNIIEEKYNIDTEKLDFDIIAWIKSILYSRYELQYDWMRWEETISELKINEEDIMECKNIGKKLFIEQDFRNKEGIMNILNLFYDGYLIIYCDAESIVQLYFELLMYCYINSSITKDEINKFEQRFTEVCGVNISYLQQILFSTTEEEKIKNLITDKRFTTGNCNFYENRMFVSLRGHSLFPYVVLKYRQK